MGATAARAGSECRLAPRGLEPLDRLDDPLHGLGDGPVGIDPKDLLGLRLLEGSLRMSPAPRPLQSETAGLIGGLEPQDRPEERAVYVQRGAEERSLDEEEPRAAGLLLVDDLPQTLDHGGVNDRVEVFAPLLVREGKLSQSRPVLPS